MKSKTHKDGTPCRCKPVGQCLSCSVGRHEECNDAVSMFGCACPCLTEAALSALL